MRTALVSLVLLMIQPLPPPFPREGATIAFENDQVAIWDVFWKKGKPTPLHEHRHTAISVTIEPGRVQSILPDGTTRVGGLEHVGNVQYGGKGLIHREEGVSDIPRRVFLIELKENTPPPDPIPDGAVPAWPREGAEKLLDNELVVVWDYTFAAALDAPLHYHDKDQIIVSLAPGKVRMIPKAGEPTVSVREGGHAYFLPRGALHREELLDGAPRIIAIQLKR